MGRSRPLRPWRASLDWGSVASTRARLSMTTSAFGIANHRSGLRPKQLASRIPPTSYTHTVYLLFLFSGMARNVVFSLPPWTDVLTTNVSCGYVYPKNEGGRRCTNSTTMQCRHVSKPPSELVFCMHAFEVKLTLCILVPSYQGKRQSPRPVGRSPPTKAPLTHHLPSPH